MVSAPVYSPSSSLSSFGSSSDDTALRQQTSSTSTSSSREFGTGGDGAGAIKFLCSYGGKILPRHPDGRLRYLGGETRVLSVDRSISFQELLSKMEELCGWGKGVTLRCQFPTMDLDALVSVTSDEDLANLLEEYYLANKDSSSSPSSSSSSFIKIRAFLHFASPSPVPKSSMPRSPPPVRGKSPLSPSSPHCPALPSPHPAGYPVLVAAGGVPYYHHHQVHHSCNHHHHQQQQQHIGSGGRAMPSPSAFCRNPHYGYLVHNGNHWQ